MMLPFRACPDLWGGWGDSLLSRLSQLVGRLRSLITSPSPACPDRSEEEKRLRGEAKKKSSFLTFYSKLPYFYSNIYKKPNSKRLCIRIIPCR
jgi:hypothetical protein